MSLSVTGTERGTFELESATGKNSACEGFGHFCVSDLAKLGKDELTEVWQTLG
ncbi:hypothetical protein VCR26J2_290076 [Vibrio coralliirubri]|nr:hypothetical protein VCR26J2_290076 [Vibrio coralliirubri]